MNSEKTTPAKSKGLAKNQAPNPAAEAPSTPFRRLPFIANFDQAEALFAQEKDPFYLSAFVFQLWLAGLVQRATAEYADKKCPKERKLQSGEGFAGFLEMFGGATRTSFGYVMACMFRFCREDESPANPLRQALNPLAVEHDCTGDYFGPKTSETVTEPVARNELARRTIVRWCDWLDAAIHLNAHRLWHTSPACFALDPESRYLAGLGNAQRHLARMDPRAQFAWVVDFATAAKQFKHSPKWTELGKAMGNDSNRVWVYADVDTLVIALWPLVKPARVGATPFWDRPASEPQSNNIRISDSPFGGMRNKNNNHDGTSVTYVLTQMCYRCLDHAPRLLKS